MNKTKLYTKDGFYVTTVFIPPFKELPKAIVWGSRIFFKDEQDNFYEDFWVAAVISGHETGTDVSQTGKDVQKNETKHTGNDDYLFGLPTNLDEAIEAFLEYYRTAKDMDSIIEFDEQRFVSYAHHASGQFLRNSWYLWWHEGHGYKEWPASKPPLVKFFNDIGISHADDMSSIITTSAYRQIHKEPLDLERQVRHYQDYWKKKGFADGIPKHKS